MVVVRLAMIRVELPHEVMVLKSLLCIRFLIAFRHRVLHPTHGAWGFGDAVSCALRLVKQAFLNAVFPLFAAAHAAELLAVAELIPERVVMLRGCLMNEGVAGKERSLVVFAFVHRLLVFGKL